MRCDDSQDRGDRQNDEDDGIRRSRELNREAGQQGSGSEPSGEADAAEDRAEPLPVRRGELNERGGESSRAAPVAKPCTMRAAITQPISGAARNMTFDAS